MAGRPVVIRTLDIGGDKPAPYLQLPAEANPFLGLRAIRISLPAGVLQGAAARDPAGGAAWQDPRHVSDDRAPARRWQQARALLEEAAAELRAAGIPHASSISTGIMVEIPSAALIADKLAPLVDFFSIGTNDLTQYTFAADRGNASVAGIGDPLHPAVLRQIARVIDAAHAAGKWVGLCGELAGRPEGIPVLLGLGLDEFSMSATAIPAAKTLLAQLTTRRNAASRPSRVGFTRRRGGQGRGENLRRWVVVTYVGLREDRSADRMTLHSRTLNGETGDEVHDRGRAGRGWPLAGRGA